MSTNVRCAICNDEIRAEDGYWCPDDQFWLCFGDLEKVSSLFSGTEWRCPRCHSRVRGKGQD